MITINEKLNKSVEADTSLTLPFELRQKSRLRTRLDNGDEAGLILSRGEVLRHGDCLRATNGLIIKIQAAAERVSMVLCDERLLLQKACYHLGNRHVPLQIDQNRICYQRDHVLDDMLISMGLKIVHASEPFEPEVGAYHNHSRHGHTDKHGDEHNHGNDHGHNHEHNHEHNH